MLLLSLTSVYCGKKSGFETHDLTSFLGDLRSVESEERKSILKSLSTPQDILVGEESRKAIVIRIDPKHNSNSEQRDSTQPNGTDRNYDLVQWYDTPSRIVEHHIEGDKLESNIDTLGKVIDNHHDFETQSTTAYREDYNNDSHEKRNGNLYPEDQQYHDIHEANDNQNPIPYHNQESENSHDGPSSSIFYKKMKLKKVRRNCTRSKSKKASGWPDRSDKIIQSRSHESQTITPIDSKFYHESMSALAEPRFNDIPKIPMFPEISPRMLGFSGQHLHGIPKTHFFHYKDGDGINHYHLHNHHHIYTPDGKKINLDYVPSYRNLINHFGKMKPMLNLKDAAKPYYLPHLTDNHRSPLNAGSLDPIPHSANTGKKGYHYTGKHEAYGRKTYKRMYPRIKSDSMSAANDDKTIGMEMYRYGAGQYGTDEFSSTEDNGRYPNEVSLNVDKPYVNSAEVFEPLHFNSHRGSSSTTSNYNSNSSPRAPYGPYSGETDSSYYNNEEKDNHSYEDKAPYVPQTHLRDERTSSEIDSGYEHSDEPNRFPSPHSHSDVKNGPDDSQDYSDNGPPPKPHVTHSESYSKDGAVLDYNPEKADYNPENLDYSPTPLAPLSPFQNLGPDPDPLAIPKNARVYEHHIRLHPMHYQLQSLLAARNPLSYPIPFGNVGSVPYPVPLHKLMPNPLKMPIQMSPKMPIQMPPKMPIQISPKMPLVAPAPIYTRPRFNQLLPALQARSLFSRWW